MRHLQFLFLIPLVALLAIGCADPRTPPLVVESPRYTETLVLWENTVSGGTEQTANFQVDRDLESATLTVAGYIVPDDDIDWYEALINDSLPATTDQITVYLVRLDELGAPETWTHEDSIIGMAYRDSLSTAAAETTAMGVRRDSLVLLVDNRFTLSLWLDSDTIAWYPQAVYLDEQATILSGQHFYSSPTDSASGTKGRWFQLRMRQWNAADPSNVGQMIELNWLSRLTPGAHAIRVRVTGSGSEITGTIVLVYSEGEL
jgi:hypothetical protein